MTATLEHVLEEYVNTYGEESGLILLNAIADEGAGGLGYTIKTQAMIDMDGWKVDSRRKEIILDSTNWCFQMGINGLVKNLREAVDTDILNVRQGLGARIGFGTGKVLLGVVETAVGFIGIIVPEPGTTAAGVVVTVLGADTVVDGLSQLAGANNAHGYSILGEGAGAMGAITSRTFGGDPKLGEAIGKGIFAVSSVALGSLGSIRILRIPGQSVRSFATLTVKGRPGGVTLGRASMFYGSQNARDGMTVISINNNAGKSILRFVTHGGQLQANARIFDVERVLRHTPVGKEMLKGLLKLAHHGFIKGL